VNIQSGLGDRILVRQEDPVCVCVEGVRIHANTLLVVEHLRHNSVDGFAIIDRCHVDEGLLEPLVTFDRDKVHAIDLPEPKLAFEDGFDGLLRVLVRDEGDIETV